MQKRILLFLTVMVLVLNACKKGTLPEEYYFGELQITGLGFEGSPDLDIYFADKKIGVLETSKGGEPYFKVTLPAGATPSKLSAYIANTDTLIADSLVTLNKNSSKSFRFIYSESLGLKGFLSSSGPVAADSTKLQFFYNVKKPFNPYPEVDLYIYTGKGRPLTLTEVAVVKGLKTGVLDSRSILLPVYDQDGNGMTYYFKLKDTKTNEFIVLPTNYINGAYFLLNTANEDTFGGYFIVNINDVNGETVDDNYIEAATIKL